MAVQLLVLAMQGTEAWQMPPPASVHRLRESLRRSRHCSSWRAASPTIGSGWRCGSLAALADVVECDTRRFGRMGDQPRSLRRAAHAVRHHLPRGGAGGHRRHGIRTSVCHDEILIGLVAATSVACVLWWVYFAFIPSVAEHMLEHARSAQRGRIARDLFTFGHFPIVTGIIAYAVVVKHMVADPNESLAVRRPLDADRLIGHADRWMPPRPMAARASARTRTLRRGCRDGAWLLIGASLPGSAAVAGIAVILAVMQSITWRRFRVAEVAEASGDR